MKDNIEVEYLAIESLTPYEKNAKKHEEKSIEVIANSIKEFGMNDPIAVWGDKNIIIEGHGRLLAAKKLGMEKVPVIRLDSLTDEQRRAYTLAHNKTHEFSDWDLDILDDELDDILDIDMSDFGFDLDLESDSDEEEFKSDEIDTDDFSDDKFECTCPKCGFKFNKE